MIFTFALVVRFIFTLLFMKSYVPMSDARQYHELATAVSRGNGLQTSFPFFFKHQTAFRPPLFPLLVLAGSLLLTAIVTMARVTGVPYRYLFQWRPVVAVALVLGVACALAQSLHLSRWTHARVTGVAVVFGVVALGSGSLTWAIVRHPASVSRIESATEEIAAELQRHGVPPGGVILRLDTGSLLALQRGVFNELDRVGLAVAVDESLEYQFGSRRGAAPGSVDEVWWVAESGRALAYLSSLPGAEVIARSTPLEPDEEREAVLLEREILAALAGAGREDVAGLLDSIFVGFALDGVPGIDPADVDRLSELNTKVADDGSCRCGVVAMAPNEAPADLHWLR